ncbi:hypothetical protein U6A24_19850 [Aquimarina gracilis]|uniref:PKD domain-containing protein n=1 Tax=Aquimarina gracilis TaxID=874422 RepID=A0ABU6A0V3_9FLAO|nr:hypothetical protein [Aquimarina gracilis]MEB3347741.1 hypothetical protein [Aquimarina gracilis]
MKKIGFILVLLVGVASCDSEINITPPTILFDNETPEAYDTLSLRVVEYADIDGSQITPDYYKWSILDKNDIIISSDFDDSPTVEWTPNRGGYYIIQVTVGYDGNKSITAVRDITVTESARSFQKRLTGTWTGTGEQKRFDGKKWKVDLTFESNGYYSGLSSPIESGGYSPQGPFYNEYYLIIDPDRPQGPDTGNPIGQQASEEVPCREFLIDKIIDNKGYGSSLSISFETELLGDPDSYTYSCLDYYDIKELVFSDDDTVVSFLLTDNNDSVDEWILKYTLTRN